MKRLALFLALLGAAAAPLAGQGGGSRIRVPFVMDTLPNGLRVIVHEDHSVPVVTVIAWCHVGSGDERLGLGLGLGPIELRKP